MGGGVGERSYDFVRFTTKTSPRFAMDDAALSANFRKRLVGDFQRTFGVAIEVVCFDEPFDGRDRDAIRG